jgi:hypothetical protein
MHCSVAVTAAAELFSRKMLLVRGDIADGYG